MRSSVPSVQYDRPQPESRLGAPLARLELRTALPILFARMPNLRLIEEPRYAPKYHFHGLENLMVARAP